MADRATFWRLAQGIALIVTGYFAGVGITLACALKNLSLFGAAHPPKIGWHSGLTLYLLLFAVTVIWAVAVFLYARRNRNPVGLSLAGAAVLVFGFVAVNVLGQAYPVCNAF